MGAPFQPFFQAPFQPQRRALPWVQALIVSGPWPSNPPLSVAAVLALLAVAVPAVALAANAAASAGSHFCGCGDLLQSHLLFCLDRRRDPDKSHTVTTCALADSNNSLAAHKHQNRSTTSTNTEKGCELSCHLAVHAGSWLWDVSKGSGSKSSLTAALCSSVESCHQPHVPKTKNKKHQIHH